MQDIKLESDKQQLNDVNSKVNFVKMDEISIFHPQNCYALAINHDNTMLLAVAESAIKVYTISSSKIKYVQLLKSHSFEVSTLNFFPNKQGFFLSGSVDSTLGIWSKNLMAYPKIIQKLKGHTSTIFTVILYCEHKNLIVSGGDDSTIKFWTTNQLDLFQWFCFQTIKEQTTQVLGLSINKEGQQIVCCILNYQIYVIEQEQYSIFWYVKQKIDVEWCSRGVCFISEHTFITIVNSTCNMSVYSRNTKTSDYSLVEEVDLPNTNYMDHLLVPTIFIQNKNLIFSKNDLVINIISVHKDENQQEAFLLEQTIDFKEPLREYAIFTISSDGKLLMIWDDSSKEISIYQCQNSL